MGGRHFQSSAGGAIAGLTLSQAWKKASSFIDCLTVQSHLMYRNVQIPPKTKGSGQGQGEHHRRGYTFRRVNLVAKPQAAVGQKKLTRWQIVWRWAKSVGVLTIVGFALCIAVLYGERQSYDTSEDDLDRLEKRSASLREKLGNYGPEQQDYHIHEGVINLRKLHATLRNPINVILVKYPLTGSGNVGDLLTIPLESAFFLEPSPLWTPGNHINAIKLQPAELLVGLFNCHRNILHKLATVRPFRIIRKLAPATSNQTENNIKSWRETDGTLALRCSKSKLRIVETARVKLESLVPLIKNEHLKVHVIHLVRDPEISSDVSIRSMTSNGVTRYVNSEDFQEELRNYCMNLSRDLEVGMALPRKRYHLVLHSELLKDTLAVVGKIYAFLGLSSWLPSVRDFLRKHRNRKKWKFPDHVGADQAPFMNWKTKKECKKVIKLFNTRLI